MHPQIRQEEPGNCPICGMELIPAANDETGTDPNALVMTAAAMELAEIQTTQVVKGNPVSRLYLPGKVMADQNNVSGVTAHVPGRITELYVDFAGAFVNEGQRMASIYSPELIAAQQELLETLKYKEQNPVLYQAARKKLELWELPISTIDEIEQSGKVMQSVDIVSPASGYVSDINVKRQEHVMEGSLMYTVEDLTSVWVMFDVYESQLPFVDKGESITFTTASLPGKTFEGTIEYLDPQINDRSRSLQIRVEAENPDNELKPNMLAEGVLESSTGSQERLLVPRSSVLWTGKRSIVFVRTPGTDKPTFTAREITLGERVGDQYIVADGLEEGEQVVVNGTFKLDSAAQLADKLSMMNRTPGTGANRTGHEGHTMSSMENNTTGAQPVDHSNHEAEMDTVPDTFKNQVKVVVAEYLILKDALVESESEKVSSSAGDLQNALTQVDMTLVKGELHNQWMEFLEVIGNESETIKNTQDLKEQRNAFITLSDAMIRTIKNFEIPGVIYEQFCPMANGGEGASWLSNEDQVANPYYGDRMHNCGETITKIEY
jgi:Cu(I)/Ag(I) efflux system membrane fusion protein